MVFPSVPLFLDPPTTWNQQQQQLALHQQQQQQQQSLGGGGGGGGGSGGGDHQQQVQQQPPQQQNQLPLRGDVGAAPGGLSGIPRPNSMADRARLARIPQPEQALKCPRCDSTNTKFCYFNNYSLSQPRHFCKTCRRYWTRGGALRNVPVGGGCRRNKRSSNKSSCNKSSSAAEKGGGASSSSSTATSSGTAASLPAPLQSLPFGMQSLHSNPMLDYGGVVPSIGLGFSSIQGMDSVDAGSMGLDQHWRLNQIQQFPFLGGMEAQLPPSAAAMFSSFDGQAAGSAATMTGSELITQLASVKMEDHSNQRGLSLARQYLGGRGGISPTTDQFWAGGSDGGGGRGGDNGVEGSSGAGGSGGGGGGGGVSSGSWMMNLSGFNSSSTGSLL